MSRKAIDRKVTTEQLTKMMIREGRSRQEGRDSERIRGRNNKSPVLKAEVTNFLTGTTRVVGTQEEIIAAAAESNLHRQTQTVGTAFCLPPLEDAFGSYVNNEANCHSVIAGTFIPPEGSDPFAVSLLQALEQPSSLSDKGLIDFKVTPELHSQAWRSQKDKTAVEPSALSNSHYFCSTFNPTLNEVDCMMRSSPLEFAFTPSSWCYITNVEILKRAGRINIDEMRLIQLMHPEYQINNKSVGKKVLANAEMYNEVADKQHGSRKHHQAALLGLNKVLIGDIF